MNTNDKNLDQGRDRMVNRMRFLGVMLVLFVGASAETTWADGGTPSTAPAGQCFVLMISGQPGNLMYARHYRERLTRFYAYFTRQARVPAANITVLSGDAKFKDDMVTGVATTKQITTTLAALAKNVKPDDQLIVIILGHGAVADDSCTLMLPGPDIEMAAFGEALNHISSANQVVLNFASNSGDAITHVSHPGRVIITANSVSQINDSDFAEFFLQALETGNPDGPVRQPQLSLLNAYNWAVLHTAQWTVRQKFSGDAEHPAWTVEGKDSAAIFKRLYGAPDVSPERQYLDSPEALQPDAPVDLVNKMDAAGGARRMITETPALEDLGTGKPATSLSVKGYEPLLGSTSGEPGFLARRVVLGQPSLLPAPAKDR